MTTKRATSYGHPHHTQRRPPDVEEALSSMLWTPYERASNTDTSSDDEDEQLKNCQLRKSKSQYDYTSLPTIPPSPTPPPMMLPATNIVAFIPTPKRIAMPGLATAATAAAAATATGNCLVPDATMTTTYYAPEDLCDASVTTPLVPFSELMFSANADHLPVAVVAQSMTSSVCSTVSHMAVDGDDDDDDDAHNNCYPNESTLAATSSSFAMSLENHKNRFSYTSYGRIPGLTKWWSSSSASSATTSSNTNATATLQSTCSDGGNTQTAAAASAVAASDVKEPPSYESLYSKQQRGIARRRRASASATQRHSKHLNIFKPVLQTLKANVSTITQGRFAGLSSLSSSSSRTSSLRQDNSRVTNTNTLNNTSNSSNQSHGNSNNSNNICISRYGNNHPASNNDSCNPDNTGPHLVHSFTDDFLTEHCSLFHRQQHVAATNVDNEHILNNNNNINCSITTIVESTEPATVQLHSITADEEETLPMIHHTKQLVASAHDQNISAETNTKSQQTEEEREQETENKQNNNFIICQQQQQQQSQQHAHETYEQSKDYDKMNTITTSLQMNTAHSAHNVIMREPREFMYSVYCHNNPMVRAQPYEGQTTAISLTRSFEVNTTYGSLTGISSSHRYSDTAYKTSFEASAPASLTTTSTTNCAETTTYNLTPNKCLAELERLYAEFRASESLREKRLREAQGCGDNDNIRYETTTSTTTGQRSVENCENMRLNVPANITTSEVVATSPETAVKPCDIKTNPSTSSVFLTTTNSVTALTNPCQRTPSLTIQVNQNTGLTCANSNINNNNNNNNNVGESYESDSQIVSNQAIVNATTTTKNGVSVINCNYVNNSNNNSNINNNNNNNKSITNLCDIAANTTNLNQISHVNKSNTNLNCTKSSNSDNNTQISKINDNNYKISNSDRNPSGKSSPYHHHSSVPTVLTNDKSNNNTTSHDSPTKASQIPPNASVNVIQVNGNNATISNTSTATAAPLTPSRTFASTECQTDDVASVQLRSPRALPPIPTNAAAAVGPSSTMTNNRDQRRRERRERRHLQHTASMMVAPTHAHHQGRHVHVDRHSMPAPPLPPILHPPHLHPGLVQNPHNIAMLRPMLPDILHNHFPPPYSALPQPTPIGMSGSMPNHSNGSPMPPFIHAAQAPPPGATLMGPPPQPPPAGTTLLTSVISTVPIPGATPIVSDGRFTLPLPIMRRSPSERSGKGCCGQWFAGPPLRALIAVVALGGVACALGGAALGATGLAGPPSSHFTAALLMIGVGVVLVTVSGAAWRMTAPGGPPCLGLGSSVDLGRCGRRPCSRGGGAPQGLLYPEFQHRPPPPSYQASMQEYRLRLLLLDRDRQNGVVRGSSPPPTYRSHAGSLLRAPLTSTIRGANGTGTAGRAESSIGGSEYSFPPSYRSRNNTPGTMSSERSIETEPSGRLLANEDIPEPLSVEQLSEYNTLQQRTLQARMNSTPTTAATTTMMTTATLNNSTIIANNTTGHGSKPQLEEKRNSMQMDKNCIISKRDSTSDKKDDLVTIVTITPQSTTDNLDNIENHNNANQDRLQCSSREQLEILAHL